MSDASKSTLTNRFSGSDIVANAPAKLNAFEAAFRYILGIEADQTFASAVATMLHGSKDPLTFPREVHCTGGLRLAVSGQKVDTIDTDANLAANSDQALPTQAAVKAYVDWSVGNVEEIDMSFWKLNNVPPEPDPPKPYRFLMPEATGTGIALSDKIVLTRMAIQNISGTLSSGSSAFLTFENRTTRLTYNGPAEDALSDGVVEFSVDPDTLIFVMASVKISAYNAPAAFDSVVFGLDDHANSITFAETYLQPRKDVVETLHVSGMMKTATGSTSTTIRLRLVNNTSGSIQTSQTPPGMISIFQFPMVDMV